METIRFSIWRMMFLLLAMPLMMVACGNDSDDDGLKDAELKTQAKGRWMCTESTDTSDGYTSKGLMVGKEVFIYANGTYTSTAPSFGTKGTYTVNGNKITAYSSSGGSFVITVTVSGDRMTWNGTANNGVTFRYQFVRMDDTGSSNNPF